MQMIPINCAETVFEPFWDPELRELDQWDIQLNKNTGTSIDKNWWCSVNFEWQNSQDGDLVLVMQRQYGEGLEISRYDRLILSAVLPEGCSVKLDTDTDGGPCSMESNPFGQEKREIFLELPKCNQLYSLKISVVAVQSASGMGWFNWVGLQDSQHLEDHFRQFRQYDSEWQGSLNPLGTPLSFVPHYGIFLSPAELEKMRDFYNERLREGASNPFRLGTDGEILHDPEACIKDYVNTSDNRYCRERDYGYILLQNGMNFAILGLLEKNAEYLRLAARYAMSLLACTNWDEGFICDFPAGSWEHRCFMRANCCYELVFIYDAAWEYFTPAARTRVFRRIAEEGLSLINYTTWRHEYIFHNNQLSLFSKGRMAAYSLLSKEWPRVEGYMEIAYEELIENLNSIILPDGGFVEGPAYFAAVVESAGKALDLYARAKGTKLQEIVPERLLESFRFVDALESTDVQQDMIPICDARPDVISQSALAFWSLLLPESRWPKVFDKSVARNGGLANDFFALLVQSMQLPCLAKEQAFVSLKEMKLVASRRDLNGKPVKLTVMGNPAGAGHTHEDKGSFVLEYAGQTFAMDPGSCVYGSIYSMIYKHCQRHNMLVPAGRAERVFAQSPCMQDIVINASGDEQSFHAEINAGHAFPEFYRSWKRTIVSDSPDEIRVIDEYALKEETGCNRVEFLWNTTLPVENLGDRVRIQGENGKVELVVPENCCCEIRTLPLFGGEKQSQIAIVQEGLQGILSIQIHLS